MRKKFSVGQIVLNLFFILICLTYILTFIMLISISISGESAIREFGYTLLPKKVILSAYKMIFNTPERILDAYKVTTTFSVVNTVGFLILSSMAAYPFSRSNYKFRKVVTWYMFVTTLFSGGLVPTYIRMTKHLHLANTMLVYMIPGLINVWNVFVMRSFFQNLPEGLVEAAKIDGASEFRIWLQIMLPLSKPMLASLGFMHLLGKWNDWNTSLLYISDTKLYSLQYLLQKILREEEYINSMIAAGLEFMADEKPVESMRYAMAVVAAGPMIIIFPFFQKYFTQGLTVGSIKG